MERKFTKHYTRDEARALLPQVAQWLRKLQAVREQLGRDELRVGTLLKSGHDVGGPTVHEWLTVYADFRETMGEFITREIQIKDLARGLVDFPAIIAGKEVFLCWEQGEDDIEFWHDLDTGFAGREQL